MNTNDSRIEPILLKAKQLLETDEPPQSMVRVYEAGIRTRGRQPMNLSDEAI
jgi:hypothetical protein